MKKQSASAALTALVMTAALFLPNAAAAAPYDSANIGGTSATTFDKFLVMDQDANVPNAEFTYSIAAGSAIDADTGAGTLAVLAGLPGAVIVYGDDAESLAFSPDDGSSTVNEDAVHEGDSVVFVTDSTDDEKYVKKTVTVDFSGVTFTEPGVYRYVITEDGTNQGVTNDAEPKRTLDVYVEDDTDEAAGTGNKLKIAGYVMYSGEIDTAPKAEQAAGNAETDVPNGAEASENKSSSYTNSYATQNLRFGKEVEGNQGSKDKYFKLTLTVSDAVAGTVYDVDLSEADTACGSNAATDPAYVGISNPDSITVGADGSVTVDYYLHDGQYITVKGLATDTDYALTEIAEDYQSAEGTDRVAAAAPEGSSDPDKLYDDPVSGTIGNKDIYTGFTNTRSGVIPTGIILSVAAPAVIGVLLLAAIVVLIVRGKRRDMEEE